MRIEVIMRVMTRIVVRLVLEENLGMWRCWFFHKWSKWSDQNFRDADFGDLAGQMKACSRCGMQKMRLLSS